MSLAPLPAIAAPEAEIDAIFTDFDKTDAPGCALGVIRDGEFIYRRGYGMANLEHGIALGPQSVFRISSTSKQFTAMAIALLAESGQISLDDPINQYFPEFPAWAEKISVKQLVYHSSGIRDYLTLAYLSGLVDDADFYTADWAIDLLARQKETNFPPGSQYLYSNSGYMLLSELLERVTGKSLKLFSEEKIFKPLRMEQTHFHDDHQHIVPLRASGYAPTDEGFEISMTTLDIVGDGGIYTTIDDLLAWDRNFYANQLGEGKSTLIDLMTTPGRISGDGHMSYAFGLDVEEYRGQQLIGHDGSFVGYRADMIRLPEFHFSVAVLCNRTDGAPWDKSRLVADHYLADVLDPAEFSLSESNHDIDADELQRYAGDFWEESQAFAAQAVVEGGRLWAVHSPTRRNELKPIAADTFRMLDAGNDVIVRYELSGQDIRQMTLSRGGLRSATFTPFTPHSKTADELSAYTGIYYSEELDIEYVLSIDQQSLQFSIKQQDSQKLSAMFDETFENPDFGAFVFKRDPSGDVSGFVLQSGRVRNLLFNKTH